MKDLFHIMSNLQTHYHFKLYLKKSGVKRLNTLGHLDQYIEQHGRIVKQSYCETV